jgi:phage tail sheath protein FI
MPDKPFGAGDHVDEMYTPDDVVAELEDSQISSSYACTYYPWVKYEDKDNSQYIFLPPTKDVVRNMAKTDNQAHPWFAPAGINRGEVDCVRAHYITKLADEDVLYNGRINPIKTFATDGAKIWGQKNLQEGESMLNRIAVRRLLLRMRKLISIACLGLIFEPNDATTKNTFLSIVTPIMDDIKANRGISDYRIEVNDTVESRQRRELPAKIYFKPYSALEYVDLNFIVTPEGVSFDAI